jgi:hypothetical protein
VLARNPMGRLRPAMASGDKRGLEGRTRRFGPGTITVTATAKHTNVAFWPRNRDQGETNAAR